MNTYTTSKAIFLISLGLAVAVFILFGRSAAFDFVYYDDNAYVFRNPNIQQGLNPDTIRWALTSTENSLYLPLTRLSFLFDTTVAGMNPFWFHLMNVFLHATGAVLLFLLLRMMTGAVWRSAAAAALLALHPLRVESVVWITERKDMLAMVFLLLSLMLYVRYARSGSQRSYAGSLALFLASLLSKPMGAALPLLLPILDFWPLGRYGFGVNATSLSGKNTGGKFRVPVIPIKRLILEKIPYAGLALIFTLITFFANRGALKPDDIVPAGTRLVNAVVSYFRYLGMMVWPHDMAFYYPYNTAWLTIPAMIGSILAITAVTVFAVRTRSKAPYLLYGWLWYLIALLPVIGIIQAGSQSMADRFTFLPMIGIMVGVVWGAADIAARFKIPRPALTLIFGVVLAAFSIVTFRQAGTWRDSETLFTHALAVTRDNHIANLNLANLYLSLGESTRAVPYYEETLRIRPENGAANFNLGNILLGEGDYQKAAVHFQLALPQFPGNPVIRMNLARALMGLGRQSEAEAQMREAERLQ